MTGRIEGKNAIITGGAGGLGCAMARTFLKEGASVALIDRDDNVLKEVVDSLKRENPSAHIMHITADLGSESSAENSVVQVADNFGSIDILVNNAGIRKYERISETTAASWSYILAINLTAYALMAKFALPHIRKSGKGAIVNISSTYAVNGRVGMGQYDATKAGILALTRTLAFEEAGHGVRVNAVCPGATLTPFHQKRLGQDYQQLMDTQLHDCLMQRWADPAEIAYPVLWLASDEASYITATTLMVDGGRPVV